MLATNPDSEFYDLPVPVCLLPFLQIALKFRGFKLTNLDFAQQCLEPKLPTDPQSSLVHGM
jgi:hypothetical protein